jgi:MFS family permease
MRTMDERWFFAIAAVAGGLILGSVAGVVVRRSLGKPSRREELQSVAKPTAVFVFWFVLAIGIVGAVAAVSPESLRDLPGDVLSYFPRILVAGFILIAGHVLSLVVATVLQTALSRASGQRSTDIARAARGAVLAAAVILALSQLGVNTTILMIAIAALLFGVSIAFALLVGLGGRDVAREIAAGRYVRRVLAVGDAVNSGEFQGVVSGVHPATLELELPDSAQIHVPYTHLLSRGFQLTQDSQENSRPGEVGGGADRPEPKESSAATG